MPKLLTVVVLIVSLTCPPAWGRPPVKPQKGNTAVPPCTEQPGADFRPGKQLTLAECSRLVSAYIEQPEWQDFLNSGLHATAQTTAASTGWAELKLDTASPADKETPFPDLKPVALERLMQLSPSISRLCHQLQTGKDPLADSDDLRAFIKKDNQNQNQDELFAVGNHSMVIKWRRGPGYVFKIARSRQDHIRLISEQNLYLWLRHPDNILLNLNTTPMRAAFNVYGKPVLALRQVDGTARGRLLSMKQHHSLNERLDFALSVIWHFCQMYRRYLEKDVLLADRHDDNIGFNEIPLQGRKSTVLDDAVLQVPVMLDLDPYWFGTRELREMHLHLPTWVPLVVGLLEQVFTPVNSDSEISEHRVKAIDQIRKFASPVFCTSSSILPETEVGIIDSVLQSCINHWFQNINPDYSELLAEARAHVEPLLTGLILWDFTPRTVAEWNIRLRENIEAVLQWLNNWKNQTRFSFLNDFTDEGIIRVPSLQGTTSPRAQQILTLLAMIHGKLRCHKCSRSFASNTDFRRHWQLHQQNRLQHCEVCGGDFTTITNHERVHSGAKPHKCELCEKCFSQSNSLIRHLRIHSGDKPYKCEFCEKCFSQSNGLKRHLRLHTGDKPYKCEHCGTCFTENCHLKYHLRIHSGDKPYKCRFCSKSFAGAKALKDHLRIHTGEKPYKCELCDKCFAQKSNLITHLRTHTGEKPYKCELCDKCFAQKSNLNSHLRSHYRDT